MRTKTKPNITMMLGRFMMTASTLAMAGFLFMGGLLMGAGGVGIFGEPVPLMRQIAGQITVVCGLALVPLAFLMLRREPTRFVVTALVITVVDLVAFMVAVRGSGPMFGLVYAVVLGVAYKFSR